MNDKLSDWWIIIYMSLAGRGSDDALQRDAQSLYGLINHEEGCFGTKDLIRYHLTCVELIKRGWIIKEHSHLLFKKPNQR